MKTTNMPLAEHKLGHFDEVLKKIGGRYLSNPRRSPDQYGYWRVDFELETAESQERWNKCWHYFERDIVEIRKDQKWRKLLRRLKGIFF